MRRAGSCTEAVRLILGNNNSVYESYNEIDVFLDLEHVTPTLDEKDTYEIVEKVLQEAERILKDLSAYGNGAIEEVKKAINNPDDPDIQKTTFQILSQKYEKPKYYFEVSSRIKKVVPMLLWNLCSGPLPPAEQIERTQALALQFGRIIDFVHRFDATKMQTPALMNDISFYRRMLMKTDDYCHTVLGQANDILMFFSGATPMLTCLVEATIDFANQSELSVNNTTDTLATFVYICRHMLERKTNFERISPKTQDFFTRIMVGAFILFDHTDQNGGFCRSSPIDVRSIVEVVKKNEKENERLLNSMKFTTKHFNDPATPKAIKTLFPA